MLRSVLYRIAAAVAPNEPIRQAAFFLSLVVSLE